MPTNFFADPATFGHRMAQKPKMAIFGMCRPVGNGVSVMCYSVTNVTNCYKTTVLLFRGDPQLLIAG